jgi:hypothetical protein
LASSAPASFSPAPISASPGAGWLRSFADLSAGITAGFTHTLAMAGREVADTQPVRRDSFAASSPHLSAQNQSDKALQLPVGDRSD